jgi:hypothetical protein
MRTLLASLTLVVAAACSGPNNPGEMPPLAPRPDPMAPMPGEPGGGGDPAPVPGAPDPIDPPGDGGVPLSVTDYPGVVLAAKPQDTTKKKTPVSPPPDAEPTGDAGAPLPPVPDALPADASRRAE